MSTIFHWPTIAYLVAFTLVMAMVMVWVLAEQRRIYQARLMRYCGLLQDAWERAARVEYDLWALQHQDPAAQGLQAASWLRKDDILHGEVVLPRVSEATARELIACLVAAGRPEDIDEIVEGDQHRVQLHLEGLVVCAELGEGGQEDA